MSRPAWLPSRGTRNLLIALFVVSLPLVNPNLRSDGWGHWSWLRSAVIDHDLRFENEYARGDLDFAFVIFRAADAQLRDFMRMPGGGARNPFPVGPAVLWAPFFLQAHALMLGARALGVPLTADGYGVVYRAHVAFGCVLFAFAALAVGAGLAEARGRPGRAAALAVLGASALPVYTYALPFHVHATAAFACALFLGAWAAPRDGLARWLAWGATAGLAASVDPLLLFFAGPVVLVAAAAALRGAGAVRVGLRLSGAGAGAVLGALPHFVGKALVHGSPFRTGSVTRFFWDDLHLREVAFGTEHGAFLWHPVLAIAAAGLVLFALRQAATGAALLAGCSGFFLAVAAHERWDAGSSFGHRYFVALTPVAVWGLAETLGWARERLGNWPPTLVLLLCGLWNAGLVVQWGGGLIPRRGPVDFAVVARQQVTEVPRRTADLVRRYVTSRGEWTRGPSEAR